MSQRIFLHIGRHKCGTTSLQRSLLAGRETLLQHGIFYPLQGIEDTGHHPIARALESQRSAMPWRRPGRQHKNRTTASGAELGEFLDALVQSPAKVAVISSESFQNCKPSTVRSYFNGFEVVPCVYLREQGSYLRSAYTQRVHASTYHDDVQRFARDFFRADYQAFLEDWMEAFPGKLNVGLYEHSQLRSGSVVADFFERVLGVPAPPETADIDHNPSLSREMLALKLELNRRGFSVDHSNYGVLADMSANGKPFRLPPDLSAWVREHHAAGNRWVAQTFFHRDDLFSEYEPAGDEQVEISEDEFRASLREFRSKAAGHIRAP